MRTTGALGKTLSGIDRSPPSVLNNQQRPMIAFASLSPCEEERNKGRHHGEMKTKPWQRRRVLLVCIGVRRLRTVFNGDDVLYIASVGTCSGSNHHVLL